MVQDTMTTVITSYSIHYTKLYEGILYAYSMLKGEIGKMFDGAGDPYATSYNFV